VRKTLNLILGTNFCSDRRNALFLFFVRTMVQTYNISNKIIYLIVCSSVRVSGGSDVLVVLSLLDQFFSTTNAGLTSNSVDMYSKKKGTRPGNWKLNCVAIMFLYFFLLDAKILCLQLYVLDNFWRRISIVFSLLLLSPVIQNYECYHR
jgi:hypothetical protein